MEHVTLKHVAKVSGFSVTTVSRVLGGTDYPISAEARDAVTKAAKDLGYIPNMLARGLKTSVSKEVAVIMPSITILHFHDDGDRRGALCQRIQYVGVFDQRL